MQRGRSHNQREAEKRFVVYKQKDLRTCKGTGSPNPDKCTNHNSQDVWCYTPGRLNLSKSLYQSFREEAFAACYTTSRISKRGFPRIPTNGTHPPSLSYQHFYLDTLVLKFSIFIISTWIQSGSKCASYISFRARPTVAPACACIDVQVAGVTATQVTETIHACFNLTQKLIQVSTK